MLAHGLQGSLLGVRALQEEFSIAATGLMLWIFCRIGAGYSFFDLH